MPVGLLTLEIQLPYSHSLKEKRAALQKLMNRLRARFNVAAAELDHQDAWQRATLALVTVASSHPIVESALRRMLDETEKILGYDVSRHSFDYFD